MSSYLLVEAAGYRLLLDASVVSQVMETAADGDVDLSRALGGGQARVFLGLTEAARVRGLGVDAVRRFLDLGAAAFLALPPMVAAPAGEDIDAITREPHDGAHAFRLRLGRSSAAATG